MSEPVGCTTSDILKSLSHALLIKHFLMDW